MTTIQRLMLYFLIGGWIALLAVTGLQTKNIALLEQRIVQLEEQTEIITNALDVTSQGLDNHNESLPILSGTDRQFVVSINNLYDENEWLHDEMNFLWDSVARLNGWMMCEKYGEACIPQDNQ